jgi:exosortase/archaeosortase family protein
VPIRTWSFIRHCSRLPALLAFFFSSLVFCVDFAFAPALRNTTFPVVFAFLTLLLARCVSMDGARNEDAAGVNPWRVVLFLLLHFGIVLAIRSAAAGVGAYQTSYRGALLATAKLLILFPTLILLPLAEWRRFALRYHAECIAALVALLTFYPLRIFATAWPWYGPLLGQFVHRLAGLFVPGLVYVPANTPRLVGPALDVTILFSCGGLDGLRLFQNLFALLVVLDWDRLNRRRALLGYFAGLATMLLANALRIALLVVAGNRISPDLVVRFHLSAGWIFFTSVFLVFFLVMYRWLMGREKSPSP